MNKVEAIEAAQRLLNQHSIKAPPVDVEAMAKSHTIKVMVADLDDETSGVLIIKSDESVIGVNQIHHENRQRFAIAHELGHYILHRESSRLFVDSTLTFHRSQTEHFQQEIQANAFAAELLMPEDMVRQYVEKIDFHDETAIRSLARKFRVSPEAMTIRLLEFSDET